MAGFVDDLAAGDEVRAVAGELEQMQTQLESLGASRAPRPMGHIVVPSNGAGIALPRGEARIDFDAGELSHETGAVSAEFESIAGLTGEASPRQPTLRNIILHSDTLASLTVGGEDQSVYFGDVPLPQSGFSEVTVDVKLPGEVSLLASTQRLPIGLGAITLHGSRHGELATAQRDAYEAVPVSPHALYDDHDGQYADPRVYTANLDTSTWTIENTSGNGNDLQVEVRALEALGSASAEFRQIASDTIPDGDHSIITVDGQRHKLMQARVQNATDGQQVGCSVDYMGANP